MITLTELEDYRQLLSKHLNQSGEEKLLKANELGRNLAKSGYEISDVVNKHFNFLSQSNQELSDLKNAHEFLLETVMAMTIELNMSTEQSLTSLYEKAVMRVFRELTSSWEREKFLHSLLRHDLRNKTQVVQGYFELLEDYDLRDEAEQYLKKAEKAMDEGMEIIEKVRILKKAEEEEIEDVRLDRLINEQIENWEAEAEENGIEIKEKYHQNNYIVKGGSLLDRVFSNIVENSIQHSEGSKIRIKILENDNNNEYICTIEDNGKGLPKEEKKKILEKGYTTDEERGTGLGMYLSKTLVETYNGDIEVKDSDMGGARFDLHLKKSSTN